MKIFEICIPLNFGVDPFLKREPLAASCTTPIGIGFQVCRVACGEKRRTFASRISGEAL